uniref:Tubulin epsilon 1 n=1 Tax=Equus caballus TaxID=9796 RepID=A0A5F5PUU2_HORSE
MVTVRRSALAQPCDGKLFPEPGEVLSYGSDLRQRRDLRSPRPLGELRSCARGIQRRRGFLSALSGQRCSMTQSVIVQVGQCGNQIGCCFWDLALREHAAVNQKGIYDEAISSFFRNVDTRLS